MSGRFDAPLRSDQKGQRSEVTGLEDYIYEVNIDWDEVRDMGFAAACSKGSQCHRGPIQVKITGRRSS